MSPNPDVRPDAPLDYPDVAFLTLRRCIPDAQTCAQMHTKTLKSLKNAPRPRLTAGGSLKGNQQ